MLKIPFNLSFSLLFCIALISSQCASTKINKSQTADTEKITQTIETYFDGWMTGDTTKLGKAMHATCQLKNIKEDTVLIIDRATYLGFFKPRPRRENAGGKIISINVTGDIGVAKCEIHTSNWLFTDYFNLMKLEDEWYIVDKIATRKKKEEE